MQSFALPDEGDTIRPLEDALLFGFSDNGHQSADATVQILLAAIGKEKIVAIHSTQRGGMYSLRQDAGVDQLIAIGSM